MKTNLMNSFLTAVLLSSVSSFAQEILPFPKEEGKEEIEIVKVEKKAEPIVVIGDLSLGNGGATVSVGPTIKVLPGVKLIGTMDGGIDIVSTTKNDSFQSSLVPILGVTGGLILGDGALQISPVLSYKCDYIGSRTPTNKNAEYGCGSRAGLNFFLGNDTGAQLGIGFSKAITNVDNGEKDQFQFMLRIPLSSNDEGRDINTKGDMDFDNSKKPVKQNDSSKA